jgi:hypothetical protein
MVATAKHTLEVKDLMLFKRHAAVERFSMVVVHTSVFDVPTMNFVAQHVTSTCTIQLRNPSIEVVEAFARQSFGPPQPYKDDEFLVMKRPWLIPVLLPFFDATIITRMALRYTGSWFSWDDIAETLQYVYEKPLDPEMRYMFQSAFAWNILESSRDGERMRPSRWFITSLEDDIADDQAEKAGHS